MSSSCCFICLGPLPKHITWFSQLFSGMFIMCLFVDDFGDFNKFSSLLYHWILRAFLFYFILFYYLSTLLINFILFYCLLIHSFTHFYFFYYFILFTYSYFIFNLISIYFVFIWRFLFFFYFLLDIMLTPTYFMSYASHLDSFITHRLL